MAAEFVLITVAMPDLSAADAAFELLVEHDLDVRTTLDLVTIGRKSSGEVRFHREPAAGEGTGRAWSAAAGLAAALYPSVGCDVPASRVIERAVLNAVAGQVAGAVGRAGLLELGELLDTAPAALIVAAPATAREELLRILDPTGRAVVRTVVFDVTSIERAVLTVRTVVGRSPPVS